MKFSMIIATYNRENLVFRTLESALQQEFCDFEVIVIDDGSTDNTQELFTIYKHPKVKYFRTENHERGAARNFGATKAKGDYLNFFDSDDIVLPNHFLEANKCVEALQSPEVFSMGVRVQSLTGKVSKNLHNLPDPMNLLLLSGNPLGCNPVFIRKDIFQKFPFEEARELAGSEDLLLWLRLASRYPFRFWNQVTSVIRDHESRSVYDNTEKRLLARNELLMNSLKHDDAFMHSYGKYFKQIMAYRYNYTALHLALLGFKILPFYYLIKAALTDLKSTFQRNTLGTIKQVVLGFFRKYKPS